MIFRFFFFFGTVTDTVSFILNLPAIIIPHYFFYQAILKITRSCLHISFIYPLKYTIILKLFTRNVANQHDCLLKMSTRILN